MFLDDQADTGSDNRTAAGTRRSKVSAPVQPRFETIGVASDEGPNAATRVGRPKIVVIGAGSASFGIDCLAGIFRTAGLNGSRLVLVDVDERKLEQVERIARRLNVHTAAALDISATPSRLEALHGADYIVLAVAIDREETWARDHEVALRYGIAHYAENGGPGAFAHTCRNLGLILPIVRDLERLCPSAYVLVLTNPLTRICSALNTASSLRFVGFCHGIGIGYWIVATALHRELGIELPEDPRFLWRDERIERLHDYQAIARERYSIRAAGINHFSWMLSVHDLETGEEVSALLRRRLAELPSEFEPLTRRLADVFGLVAVQSDTHISEHVSFASEAETWTRFDIQLYDFEWAKAGRERHNATLRSLADGTAPLDAALAGYTERVEFVIDAIVNNRHGYEEALNVPNRGYIENLPWGAVVEVPCIVDASGVSGTHVGALPEPIAALCRTQLTIADLNVRAFVTGDRDLVRQLLAIDPMVRDLDAAIQLADEYIELYHDYFSFDGTSCAEVSRQEAT
jgi:alpha-galactosidase